jgi:hypothetical protein
MIALSLFDSGRIVTTARGLTTLFIGSFSRVPRHFEMSFAKRTVTALSHARTGQKLAVGFPADIEQLLLRQRADDGASPTLV